MWGESGRRMDTPSRGGSLPLLLSPFQGDHSCRGHWARWNRGFPGGARPGANSLRVRTERFGMKNRRFCILWGCVGFSADPAPGTRSFVMWVLAVPAGNELWFCAPKRVRSPFVISFSPALPSRDAGRIVPLFTSCRPLFPNLSRCSRTCFLPGHPPGPPERVLQLVWVGDDPHRSGGKEGWDFQREERRSRFANMAHGGVFCGVSSG